MDHEAWGVLEDAARVAALAGEVRVVPEAVDSLAEELSSRRLVTPTWRTWPHYWGAKDETANYVLLLDALNFCFWNPSTSSGQGPSTRSGQAGERWRVEYRGRSFDGYWALAAALRRAIDAGEPILDARYLAEMTMERLEMVLRGRGELALMEARLRDAQKVGRVLLDRYQGRFANFIEAQAGSCLRLVPRLVEEFPSFDDTATYGGRRVRFYKRAQLLASDLYGAFEGQGVGRFDDLDRLTAFADYKIPQVLRGLSVLRYSDRLAQAVDHGDLLAAGSPEEVEIRAATIWAVELLRRALAARGQQLRAFEIDWHLWGVGQERVFKQPYHRTLTTAY